MLCQAVAHMVLEARAAVQQKVLKEEDESSEKAKRKRERSMKESTARRE